MARATSDESYPISLRRIESLVNYPCLVVWRVMLKSRHGPSYGGDTG